MFQLVQSSSNTLSLKWLKLHLVSHLLHLFIQFHNHQTCKINLDNTDSHCKILFEKEKDTHLHHTLALLLLFCFCIDIHFLFLFQSIFNFLTTSLATTWPRWPRWHFTINFGICWSCCWFVSGFVCWLFEYCWSLSGFICWNVCWTVWITTTCSFWRVKSFYYQIILKINQ